MKKYRSKSLSFQYHPQQDRLQCISCCEEDIDISIWISRRLLWVALPKFAQWMEQNIDPDSLANKVNTKQEKSSIIAFEHERAQQKIPSNEEKKKFNIPFANDFLLHTLRLTGVSQNKIALTFQDEHKTCQVVSILSHDQLHKVIGELLRLSDHAHWALENPWKKVMALGYQSGYSSTRLM